MVWRLAQRDATTIIAMNIKVVRPINHQTSAVESLACACETPNTTTSS
jgi:hypothetical protein